MKRKLTVSILILAVAVALAAKLLLRDDTALPSEQQPNIGTNTKIAAPGSRSARAELAETLVRRANAPITFYGEVLDQDAAPLAGVTVACQVGEESVAGTVIGQQKMVPVTAVTGPDGRFKIENQNGAYLNIAKLEKEGYVTFEREGNVFSYAGTGVRHEPDPGKPVTFTLVARDKTVKLEKWETALEFPWDGVPRRYDLKSGKPSETGELEIVARRKRYDEEQPRDFDWCLDVRVPGGGLVPVDPRRLTAAPEAGYVEVISLGHGYEDRENQHAVNALTLCVKSPANAYGVVKVSCKASSDSRSRNLGRLQGAWNPTGSRVLLETPWTAPER